MRQEDVSRRYAYELDGDRAVVLAAAAPLPIAQPTQRHLSGSNTRLLVAPNPKSQALSTG